MQNGLLEERELDISLQRIYEKAFQLGVIDSASPGGGADHPNANPYVKLGAEVVDTPAHRALALEGAIQVSHPHLLLIILTSSSPRPHLLLSQGHVLLKNGVHGVHGGA